MFEPTPTWPNFNFFSFAIEKCRIYMCDDNWGILKQLRQSWCKLAAQQCFLSDALVYVTFIVLFLHSFNILPISILFELSLQLVWERMINRNHDVLCHLSVYILNWANQSTEHAWCVTSSVPDMGPLLAQFSVIHAVFTPPPPKTTTCV